MKRRVLAPEELVAWIRLARAESVGPVTFRHLTERYASPSQALEALPELARRGGRAAAPRIPSIAEVDAEIAAGAQIGASVLASCDPRYPLALAALDAPAPLLWVLGDVGRLSAPMVAIVGARIASAAGRAFARDLAGAIGRAGWTVVSGMARGIDAAAHEGAIATGTVAVLAGGVDDIYPPEHAALHRRIAQLGAVVSERPPGTGAKAADFPRRNRIISGLSRGVVVVEAELRSGSLITARLAGDQGREVFAVPGSPLDPRSRGANDLIRQGATLVEDADDVLRVLDALPGVSEDDGAALEAPLPEAAGGSPDEALRARLYVLLSPTPVPINLLARELAAPVAAVLAALMELALAGRADLSPGGLAARL